MRIHINYVKYSSTLIHIRKVSSICPESDSIYVYMWKLKLPHIFTNNMWENIRTTVLRYKKGWKWKLIFVEHLYKKNIIKMSEKWFHVSLHMKVVISSSNFY